MEPDRNEAFELSASVTRSAHLVTSSPVNHTTTSQCNLRQTIECSFTFRSSQMACALQQWFFSYGNETITLLLTVASLAAFAFAFAASQLKIKSLGKFPTLTATAECWIRWIYIKSNYAFTSRRALCETIKLRFNVHCIIASSAQRACDKSALNYFRWSSVGWSFARGGQTDDNEIQNSSNAIRRTKREINYN